MQTLAIGTSNKYLTSIRNARGFTLIEVLVVMVIISIMMSFAVITIGGSKDRALEEEAKRLTALMRMGAEEAVLRSTDYVLTVARDGYQFYEWDIKKNNFVPVDALDGVFRPRTLPKDMTLGGEINGSAIVFAEKKEEDTAKKSTSKTPASKGNKQDEKKDDNIQDKPAIFFFSSGERIPFALELHQDFGSTFKILGDLNGKIDYQAPQHGA